MKKGNEYKVIVPFTDLQDTSKEFPYGKVYAVGDIYSGERIKELGTNKNKIGRVLIEEVEKPQKEEVKKDAKSTKTKKAD